MTTVARPTKLQRAGATAEPLDVQRVRRDFPIMQRTVHDKPLVYLDSAATSQKPQVVIDALGDYYSNYNSNIHRGLHVLSEQATAAYEQARDKVRGLINAADAREIIFVRGTTEAINLVSQSYGRSQLKTGDEVLITHMEHHSNIVPWQIVCEQTGAVLRAAAINERGELPLDEFEKLLTDRTKIVSVAHVSNALGTVNPIRRIVELAHQCGAVVLVDGAQAVPHAPVDVQALGCDFYAFSGHKMYGPTGIGVLYGRAELLDAMPPYQAGGDMIKSVTIEKTIYNDLPYKFEAGTPDIAGVIGLGVAVDYMQQIGIERIAAHEHDLLSYATEVLSAIGELRIIGTAEHKAAVISFLLDSVHPHDIGTIVDGEGVAIRTGHHCAQPVMEHFGIPATARASFGIYNSREDVDALAAALNVVKEVFK